jgi:membrane-associated phospholipid phosphatase
MIATAIPNTKTPARTSGEFRSPDLLGKHPLIGVMLFLLGCLIFGLLAYYIKHSAALVLWDIAISNRMHAAALNSPAWMKDLALAGSYLGLQVYMGIMFLLGLYFLVKKFWEEFFMVAILMAGEGIFWHFFTNYFARTRPAFSQQLEPVLQYPSFPSGHTICGVILFGLLAYFLVPRISSPFGKVMMIIFAVLMMLFIAYSRFFLGAHYLTDVAAGLAGGVAWTSLVIMVIEIFYKKGDQKYAKN